MIFIETNLPGAFIIKPELLGDERGFFARIFCRREFQQKGLEPDLVQSSLSFNKKEGTVRGLHYQQDPFAETKLVRCSRGVIYDVIVDLRPESLTFRKWTALELSEENRLGLYIPKGLAHGFQTLEDNVEVLYQMSEFFHPEAARGIRWNDPSFGIQWPMKVTVISEKDRGYPDFQ